MKPKIVRYRLEDIPRMTDARAAELEAQFEDPDFKIDYSDIPEQSEEEWAAARAAGQVFVGRFYRTIKKPVSVRIDADVLDWLKKEGDGYQSRMNAILRREMLKELMAQRKADWAASDARAASRAAQSPVVSARHAAPAPLRARTKK